MTFIMFRMCFVRIFGVEGAFISVAGITHYCPPCTQLPTGCFAHQTVRNIACLKYLRNIIKI